MLFLRSLLFNILVFLLTMEMALEALPCFFGKRHFYYNSARRWSNRVNYLLKKIIGIEVEIKGKPHLEGGPFIIASKHQSFWETGMIEILKPDCTAILKKELTYIPLFGQMLLACGMISVDRKKGRKNLNKLITIAQERVNQGRSIWIFPEGTRRKPYDPPDYKAGVYLLYHHLKIPVVPIALNSGHFWGRRDFIKKPGKIIIEALPPIMPGLSGREFLSKLQNEIETASNKLIPSQNQFISIDDQK